jgi:hypothetical protein
VIPALLVRKDSDSGKALVFHPPVSKDCCGSFELCEEEAGVWHSCNEDYVNVV